MKVFAQKSFLPVIRVEGSGYDLGYKIGQQVKTQIQKTLFSENLWFSERRDLDRKDSTYLDKILKITRQHFPNYIDEILGYADGADVPFRDLWVINSADHQTMQFETCTDLFLHKGSELLLGHNEDFNDINSDPSYFLHIKTENGIEIFSHTYPGALPGTSFAMNSEGMCFTCNTLPNPLKSIGVSRKIIDRWLLEAPSISESLRRIQFKPRCGVFSYNIASQSSLTGINVETNENEIFISEVFDYLYHTNHYVHLNAVDVPIHPTSTSKTRYQRLQELCPPKNRSPEAMLDILSDSKILSIAREIYPGWSTRSFATVIFHFTNNRLTMEVWPYSRKTNEKITVIVERPPQIQITLDI